MRTSAGGRGACLFPGPLVTSKLTSRAPSAMLYTLTALDAYIEKKPEDVFGRNFKGYILYRKGEDAQAAEVLETALSLAPDNCYAHYYLSRIYTRRFDDAAAALDPRRKTYERRFQEHTAKVQSYRNDNPLRVEMLMRWLEERKSIQY